MKGDRKEMEKLARQALALSILTFPVLRSKLWGSSSVELSRGQAPCPKCARMAMTS